MNKNTRINIIKTTQRKLNFMKRLSHNIILLLTITLFIIFDFILNKYTFPLTEGWWETYSWLSDNFTLYKDYNLPFPPLFIELISFIRSIVGEDFYSIRSTFLLLRIIEMLSIYLMIKFVTRESYSAIFGMIVAQILVVALNPVYLVKDYHILVAILVNLTIISHFYSWNYLGIKRLMLIILSGIFLAGLILTKQNVAVLLIAGSFASYFVGYYRKEFKIHELLLIVLSIILPIVIYTFTRSDLWVSAYLSNDSKGSAGTVFTRFLSDPHSIKIYLVSIFLWCLIISYKEIDRRLGYVFSKFKYEKSILFGLFLSTVVYFNELIIPLALGWPLIRLFLHIRDKLIFRAVIPVLMLSASLAYAGTMTAGYNFVSMEVLIAICYAEIYLFFKDKRPQLTIILACIFATILFTETKIFTSSYSWWGYNLSPVLNAKQESKFPELKNIKLDKITSEILEQAYNISIEIKEDQTIFAYPNIPIFYKLLKKSPIVSYPVQWFDVFPTKKSNEVIKSIENKKPEYIFWLKPPAAVYSGHAMLRKMESGMSLIDRFLMENIDKGIYKKLYKQELTDNFYTKGSYQNEVIDPVFSKYNCNIPCDLKFIEPYFARRDVLEFSESKNTIKIKFKNIIAQSEFDNNINFSTFQRVDELFSFLILKKN